MSKYYDKITKNEMPLDSDWNEHLLNYHKKQPGLSEDMFGKYDTNLAKTSYHVLADYLKNKTNSESVAVDLACGNGPLIRAVEKAKIPFSKIYAIDMSQAELDLAQQMLKNNRVTFLCENATKLSLLSESVDVVMCHMAVMLMKPLEEVIKEIYRILKNKGLFIAVVTDPVMFEGAMKDYVSLVVKQAQIIPDLNKTLIGDKRFNSLEGIKTLFSNVKFSDDLESIQYHVVCYDTPEKIWDCLKTMYLCDLLPEDIKQDLKKEVITCFSQQVDFEGKLKANFRMRLFCVKK